VERKPQLEMLLKLSKVASVYFLLSFDDAQALTLACMEHSLEGVDVGLLEPSCRRVTAAHNIRAASERVSRRSREGGIAARPVMALSSRTLGKRRPVLLADD
jgi:hypothetical protein